MPHLGSDLGYSAVVTLLLVVVWTTTGIVTDAVFQQTTQSLPQVFVQSVVFLTIHMLPAVPIAAIAANRAPAAGMGRYLSLGVAGALCMLWWYLANKLMGAPGPNPGMDDLAETTTEMFAIAYRSSARTAGDSLVRKQIDNVALDAEFKQTRLQLLRAQIEPHFLFNTLATVRTLGRIDRDAAVDMIDNLMRYLSEALPKLRQEETTLADEQQLVLAYLRIHQIRMGSRLNYEFIVPPDLRETRIPTMILLTLVENALTHGINPALAGGYIRVSVAREQAMLVLKVSDTGRGLSAKEGHGTGLANIRQRLTLRYGERAELTLLPEESHGVVATVSLPMGSDP
jgi:signal transduction histidine kinase